MARSIAHRCLAVLMALTFWSAPMPSGSSRAWAGPASAPRGASQARPTAASAKRTTVAVVPLTVSGEMSDADQAILTDELIEGLRRGNFEIIPPQKVVTTKADAAQCEEPKCWKMLAEATKSSHLVRARVTVADRDYEVNVELVDGLTGEVVVGGREGCEICGIADAGNLMTSAAATLRTKLDALSKGEPVLSVTSTPKDAIVAIDGAIVGTTPVQRPVVAGKHIVRVSKEGYIGIEREVTFVEGSRESLSFELEKLPNRLPSRPWGWASLSVGIAALGGGITLVAFHGLPYDVGDSCSMPDNRDANGECRWLWDTKWYGTAAAVAGAALVTLGIAVLINTAKRQRATRGRVKGKGRPRARLGPNGAVRF